jgi:arabinose-5-phosphate isomerase
MGSASHHRSASAETRSNRTRLSEFEQLDLARDVIAAEGAAISKLARNLPLDFHDAAELIYRCCGSVIVTGMGKAGWIGQKISASFASTGTCSHFLHPAEAIHGDLGRVGERDLILILSNSGETDEVLHLLPTFRKLGVPIIAITGKEKSTLSRHSTLVLNYGIVHEAGHLGLAPSTTTSLMLALGDALALVVSRMKEFSANDFARFHPGGALGKRLSQVDDLMRPIDVCRTARESESVRDVYKRFSGETRRSGVILVVNEQGKLTGLFTDSDLARLLERNQENRFNQPISSVMTCQPVVIRSGERCSVAVETLACRNLSELPVIDSRGCPLGLIDITDVVSFLPS